MTDIATTEPSKIVAGDTVQWKRELSDYPASEGWTLGYAMVNSINKISVSSSASGADHLVTISAATSAAYVAGTYYWQAYVTKTATSERRLIDTGSLIVEPNFAAIATHDARTHVKKVLDSIQAVIEGRATKDQEEYTIGNRSLKRTPIADLIKLKKEYEADYAREVKADNLRKGLGSKNRILVRM